MNAILLTVILSQAPQINIDAPDQVDYGSLIVCRPSDKESDVTWVPIEPLDQEYELFGNVLVMASGCSPKQIVMFAIDWDNHKIQRVIVQVGDKPKPNPDPNPEPNPPPPTPGIRKVVIIEESSDRQNYGPSYGPTCQRVQAYCNEKGHDYGRIDDDAVTPDGQQPAWLLEYLDLIRRGSVEYPVLVVDPEVGQDQIKLTHLTTANAAIRFIQENGG